jgi:hypothetical protein
MANPDCDYVKFNFAFLFSLQYECKLSVLLMAASKVLSIAGM